MHKPTIISLLILLTLYVVQNLALECGEVQVSFGLVANGNKSRHGEWPFLVSLHVKKQRGPDEFFCGASLINEWTLVTGETFRKFFTVFNVLFL